jgi:hypothetical protein
VSDELFDAEELDAIGGLHDGDPEPIVALLRETARPLHPRVRLMLADALTENGNGAQRLVFVRRRKGKPADDEVTAIARKLELGEKV